MLSSLPAPWPAVASAFLTEAQLRGGSLRTPVEYARILSRFFARYPNPTQVTPIGIHTFAYGRSPGRAGPAASTICVRLAAISGFYAFAQRLGAIDRNPAADIRRPRPSAPLPRGLEPDQLQRLLAAVPPTASGRRDRAIILLVLLEGLRRSEVLGLRAADIDLGTGDYQIQVKGGHRRRRRLPPPVLEAIAASLAARGTSIDRLGPNALVFPISGSGFYANLRRYAAAAGLEGVSPHALRHAAAKLRRRAGASIEAVSFFLGHASIATTAVYLRRLETEPDEAWPAVAMSLGVLERDRQSGTGSVARNA